MVISTGLNVSYSYLYKKVFQPHSPSLLSSYLISVSMEKEGGRDIVSTNITDHTKEIA
jgi:hypothetical protein